MAASAHGAETFRDCPDCPEMVVVPPGSFLMGTREEEIPSLIREEGFDHERYVKETPRREVRITRAFAIGRTEVTLAEFAIYAAATGHQAGSDCYVFRQRDWAPEGGHDWRDPGIEQDGRHPVVCMSWLDAAAYAEWLSRETGQPYRLPSEAEWEYAARAGTNSRRIWGDGWEGQCEHANGSDQAARKQYGEMVVVECDDGAVHTAAVGSFAANEFGLHDMLGNAYEWVEDCYRKGYANHAVDGSPWLGKPCINRVIRGGAWASRPVNLRSASRHHFEPWLSSTMFGFRVARDLD
ncbi:MAG: formylglycine-generating enzyme family protein [Alphaproteobacteria bacterium]|nr:formylglycine-generating enzyme family protein [Alphaproteobacteria bacterium]